MSISGPKSADKEPHWRRPSVGVGLTVVSTLAPTLGIPLPTWARWIAFVAGVLLILWPIIAGAFQRLRRVKVEPIHLTIVGLVGILLFGTLALSGVLWQRYGTPQEKAEAAKPEAADTKPLKKMLTAYDVERRQRAIDELLDLLDKTIAPDYRAGDGIRLRFFDKVANKTAANELDIFAESLKKSLEAYFDLANRNQQFIDIWNLAHSWQTHPNTAVESSLLLRAELQEMAQRGQIDHARDYLKNNKLLADWIDALQKLNQWLSQKKTSLLDKRKEYDGVEVYPVNKTENAPPMEHRAALADQQAAGVTKARFYSASEKERIADLIAKFHQILNRDGKAAAQEARVLTNVGATASKENIESVLSRYGNVENRLNAIYRGVWKEVINIHDNADVASDLEKIVGKSEVLRPLRDAIQVYTGGLRSVCSSYDALETDSRVLILIALDRAGERVRMEADKLDHWIGESNIHIDEVRRQLA